VKELREKQIAKDVVQARRTDEKRKLGPKTAAMMAFLDTVGRVW